MSATLPPDAARPYFFGDKIVNSSLAQQARPSGKGFLSLSGKLSAVSAAIITFETVLIMAGGFGWALTGLLDLPEHWAWVGGGLAFLLALISGIWLLRRAWQAEQDVVNQAAGEAQEGAR